MIEHERPTRLDSCQASKPDQNQDGAIILPHEGATYSLDKTHDPTDDAGRDCKYQRVIEEIMKRPIEVNTATMANPCRNMEDKVRDCIQEHEKIAVELALIFKVNILKKINDFDTAQSLVLSIHSNCIFFVKCIQQIKG